MALLEDKRSELVAKGKSGPKEADGKTRFEKRMKSRIASSNREYNQINMNDLFKKNILTVNIPVTGETDNYIVTFSFGGFLDQLHTVIRDDEKITLRHALRAIVNAFNSDNVYIRCSCDDFKYRFAYWLSKTDIITGPQETRPSNITNPRNSLGSGCKHIMLCLNNTGWCIKVAAVIKNYIEYIEKHLHSMYAKVIYPAIWQKPYEEPVQTSMFDTDDLESDTDTIDTANKSARERGRFTSDNQPTKPQKTDSNQLTFDDIEIEDNDEE